MNTYCHSIKSLFDQLGLESSTNAIARFVKTHQLDANIALEDAPFWKPSQVAFFNEAHNDDADWAETVDQLNALLHKISMKS